MAWSNTVNSVWTDEAKVEKLKKLWADGLSCSQIAVELGGVSRNAVIGKIHRLGLSGRTYERSPKEKKPRRSRAKPIFNFGSAFGAYPSDRPARPYVPKASDIVPLDIPFNQIQTGQCKFIAGDAAFDAPTCGHPVKPGTSYCPGHAALCFTHLAARSRYTEKYVAYVAEANAGPGAPVEVQPS